MANIFDAIAHGIAEELGAEAVEVPSQDELPGRRPGRAKSTPPHFEFEGDKLRIYKYKASLGFDLNDPELVDEVKLYVGSVKRVTYEAKA